MTVDALKNRTQKDLAQLAKKRGVAGWHGMKKDQLVRALLKLAKKASTNGHSNGKSAPVPARRSATKAVARNKPTRDNRVVKRIEAVRAKHERMKNLAGRPNGRQ